MKFILDINPQEFDENVLKFSKSNFVQLSPFFVMKKTAGEIKDYFFCGVKDNGKYVALCAVMITKISKLNTFRISYGPIYNDIDVLGFFLEEIKALGKKRKVDRILIESNDVYKIYNHNDEEIYTRETDLVDFYKEFGYYHSGFYNGRHGMQPRFTFILDTSKTYEQMYSSYGSKNKKILRRLQKKYVIDIEEGTEENLGDFIRLRAMLAQKKGFDVKNEAFYKKFLQVYNDVTETKFMVVKLNIEKTTEKFDNLIKDQQKIIENVKSQKDINEKAQKKLDEASRLITNLSKEREEVLTYKDSNVFQAFITIKVNDTIMFYQAYSSNEIKDFYPAYLKHDYFINYYAGSGMKLDLYGSPGNVDKSNKYYGLHNFKKKFGGDLVEYYGEFYFDINKRKIAVINFLKRIKSKLR